MSTIAVDAITDNSGGVTATINGLTPTPSALTGRNKIINGRMDISQRGATFAAIANGAYSLDRWRFANTSAAVVTASQQADAPSNNEFQNSLRIAVTTADAVVDAGDVVGVEQRIEGANARDLIGRTLTLSFWVRSSKTGIHCVSLVNAGDNRSYVAEYTVSVANTWEFKTITVSGGLITAGTWDWGTGIGVNVRWALAAGTTFRTTANAWQAGNFTATANQVNVVDTIGNIFAITGAQLEAGAVASPFEHRPFGTELALCQRYYEVITGQLSGNAFTASNLVFTGSFRVSKRATPTVTATTNGTWIGVNTSGAVNSSTFSNGVTIDGYGMDSLSFAGSITQGSGCVLRGHVHVASVEL